MGNVTVRESIATASRKTAAADPPAPEGTTRKSYNQPCLIAQTLGVIGDRWTLLILRDLMAGLQRYSDILESCAGMSPNVLADRLKRLEAEGLIERHYVKALPPRVDYSLTEKGWAVRPILLSLIDWGRQYMDLPPVRSVGTEVPTDFVVRTAPTFLFRPERAQGLTATMVVELADCDDCNTWSFAINDGHFYPRRRESGPADVRLTTTTRGFFRFIRGEAPPHECGELQGEPELAVLIQACFIAS